MSDAPRTPSRSLAARRARELDVYGSTGESFGPARPNVFFVIWRRRWIVVTCILLGLIVGTVINQRAVPVYSSGAVVYVQDNALKMVSDPMGGGGRSTGYLFTQCQLITSTAILSAALDKPDVMHATCLQGVNNPVGVLKASVGAMPDKVSDLITVTMESGNPEDAALIVNAVVEAYIDYQNRQHKSTAVEVLRIFQKEVDEHEKELQDKQKAMLQLQRDNPDLALETQSGGNLGRLGTLSGKLTDAQLHALELKTASAEAEAVKDDPYALKRLMDRSHVGDDKESVLDPAMLSDYRQSRKTLTELLDRLGSNHEMVKEAEKQISRQQGELQQASHDAAVSYASLLKEESALADAQVVNYAAAITEARKSAIDLNFKKVEFEQLAQDKERITRSLDLLDSRVKEVNVNEDVGSLTVSVLEPAKASYGPVRPNKSKNMGLALVFGALAGVGLAMLRDFLDQRLRSADEITRLLEMPILGVVPHMLGSSRVTQRGRIVQAQPRSNVSESYRTIRTALSFGINESGAKTILFTSPAPGDGKSTSVSNLALAFALSGRRTLLIDADCRRPTQDRIYDIKGGPGLADVLAGTAAIVDAVRSSGVDKLDVLPCGSVPHNPAELLDSQALIDLLADLSGKYDQILIDSPPVVPVTDARILAASCDAAILVLRADRSTRRLAEHARDALQSVGANLIGLVVNDVPRGQNGYSYDYYGSYGYKSVTHRAGTNGDGKGVMQVSQRTIDG